LAHFRRRTGLHFGGKCALGLAIGLIALAPIVPAQAQYAAPGGLTAPGPFGLAPGAFTTAPGAYGAPGPAAAPPAPPAAAAPLEIPAVPPAWLITPSFTLGETYTDNVNLGPAGSRVSDFVTSLGPSLALSGQTGRLTVALTYDPQELLFVRSKPSNVLQQNLLGSGTAILWPEALFFDASASIAQAYAHPTGPIAPTTITTSNNLTTVYAANASPYLRQHLGAVADSESRYRFSTASTDAVGIAPEDTHELRQTFVGGEAFGRLGWQLTGDYTRLNRGHDPTDPLSGISSKDELGRADLSYPLFYSLSLIGGVGYERISDPTLTTQPRGVIWDAGLSYQPNQLVAVSLTYGERFNTNDIEFNGTYNLDPQLRLSAIYTETIQTSLSQIAGTTSQTALTLAPDGTLVAVPVTTPGATTLTTSASGITSGAFLARSATLAATLTKERDTYSLTGYATKISANSRATVGTTLATRTTSATFASTAAAVTAERILGGAFSWDHKLWPDLDATAGTTYYHTAFLDGTGRVDNTYTVALGLSYLLSRTTTATISLSRSDLRSNIEADSLVVDTVMATIRKTF
jgi:uncharacterized protein (PEP-CTERM system associated)